MSLLSLLLGEKKKTANVAKERLQFILTHERTGRNPQPDYLPDLQRDLVAVLSKYVKINPDDIKVNLERHDNLEVLEDKKRPIGRFFVRLSQAKDGFNRLCLNACQDSFCYVSQHRAQDSHVDHDHRCAA
jgi:cell division topological specificity factor